MIDVSKCAFKYVNTRKIKPIYLFRNDHAKEVYESDHVRNATKRFREILYAKYEMVYLHKVMETQYQHPTVTQHNKFLKQLQKSEELFDGTIGT